MAVYKIVATIELNVEASNEVEAEEMMEGYLYNGEWSSSNITIEKFDNIHGEKVYKRERNSEKISS